MFVTQLGTAILVIEQDIPDESPALYWWVLLNDEKCLASSPWLLTDCRRVNQ